MHGAGARSKAERLGAARKGVRRSHEGGFLLTVGLLSADQGRGRSLHQRFITSRANEMSKPFSNLCASSVPPTLTSVVRALQ